MIPTPIALRREIKDLLQSGQRFDFGIRPEALRVETGLPHVRGKVKLVEPLGRETLVRVDVETMGGAVELILMITGTIPKIGELLPIAFDLKQMFLFDPGTGDRLYPVVNV